MVLKKIITWTFPLALVAIWISCVHEPLEGPIIDDPGNDGTDTTIYCDPDTVYFQEAVLPLIVSSCAIPGCHDVETAEDDVILNNYANIISTGKVEAFDLDGSDLFEVITEDDPDKLMPPPDDYPPLSIEEIDIIRNWILQGALNNSCVPSECDTSSITYTGSIGPIFSAKCTGCHSGTEPQGAISLTNYQEIRNQSLFGNVLAAIEHQEGVTNMPFNSAQLPPCEIDLIRTWIENGAPE